MSNSPYKPGQRLVNQSKIDAYADAMRQNTFHWGAMSEPILVDANGVVTQGHHRLIASVLANVSVPNGMIGQGSLYRGPMLTWADVWVRQ